MRRFNSTIKIKKKKCARCGDDHYIFSNGMCKQCWTITDVLKDEEEETERVIKDEGLRELVKELDDLVSKYVRLSSADEFGQAQCYTCGDVKHWTLQQCGHFIPRAIMYLRYDLRNLRVQCSGCNEHKGGNLPEYRRRLNEEWPGIVEILEQESTLVHKIDRTELRDMILEYKIKNKQLKNGN